MSKISDFYAEREELKKRSGQIELEDKLLSLEEKLLREELLPAVGNALRPLLLEVKSPLTLSINYMPDGALAISFTRNSMIMRLFAKDEDAKEEDAKGEDAEGEDAEGEDAEGEDVEGEDAEGEGSEDENIENEKDLVEYSSPTQTPTELEEPTPAEEEISEADDSSKVEQSGDKCVIAFFSNGDKKEFTKSSLRNFYVKFPNGSIYCEKKAKDTLIKVLKRIGLSRIYSEAPEIKHRDYQLVDRREFKDETVKNKDNIQEKVDGYYIFKNTSTPEKIRDILNLSIKFNLGLKVYSLDDIELTDVDYFQKSNGTKVKVKKYNSETPLPSNNSKKKLFQEWLFRNCAYKTARSYMAALENSVKDYINKYVDEEADSVFSFTTIDEMETCIGLLESNEDYMALDAQKLNRFNISMKKWMQFLKEENEKKNLLNSM